MKLTPTGHDALRTPQRSPFTQHFGANWLSPSGAFFQSPYQVNVVPHDILGATRRNLDDSLTSCMSSAPAPSGHSSFRSIEMLKTEASRQLHSGRLSEAKATAECGLAILRTSPPAPPAANGDTSDDATQSSADILYLLLLLGEAQTHLGQWVEARQALCQAKGIIDKFGRHPDRDVAALFALLSATCHSDLAYLSRLEGDLSEALRLYQEVLAMQESLTGEDSLEVASCLNAIGVVLTGLGRCTEALEILFRCQRIQQQGSQSAVTEECYTDPSGQDTGLEGLEQSSGMSSRRAHHVTFSLSPAASSAVPVVTVKDDSGPGESSQQQLEESHDDKAVVTKTHRSPNALLAVESATTLNNIANTYMHLQQYQNAINFYSTGQQVLVDAISAFHPDVATGYFNLGSAYKQLGEYRKAQDMYAAAREIREQLFGPSHAASTACHIALADVLLTLGDLDEAVGRYEYALRMREAETGADSALCGPCYVGLGNVCLARQQAKEALEWHRRAHEVYTISLGQAHPETLAALCNMATAQLSAGEYSDSLQTLEHARSLVALHWGPAHPSMAIFCNNIGNVLRAQSHIEKAKEMYGKGLAILDASGAALSPSHATLNSNLGALAFGQGDMKAALRYFHVARSMRDRLHGLCHVETASAYYHLGLVRLRLGRFDAALEDAHVARAILLQLHSGDTAHPDIAEASRLVALIVRRRSYDAATVKNANSVWRAKELSCHRHRHPDQWDHPRHLPGNSSPLPAGRRSSSPTPSSGTQSPTAKSLCRSLDHIYWQRTSPVPSTTRSIPTLPDSPQVPSTGFASSALSSLAADLKPSADKTTSWPRTRTKGPSQSDSTPSPVFEVTEEEMADPEDIPELVFPQVTIVSPFAATSSLMLVTPEKVSNSTAPSSP